MKKIAATVAFLVLVPALSSAAQNGNAVSGSRVFVVNGNVSAAQGSQPAHRVTNSEPILSGTLISTGDNSAALLQFMDGQIVTMQANSTLEIRDYRYDARRIKRSSIVLSMREGGMHFVTGRIGKRDRQAFRLLAPNATINVHGTDFMIDMHGDSMYGRVLQGRISMTNASGMKMIGAGQSVVVASSDAAISVVSASTLPVGTFSALLAIPVNPAAIPVVAPVTVPPAPSPPPLPVPVAVAAPVPDAPPATVVMAVPTTAAADVPGSVPEPAPAPAETVAAAIPEVSPKPAEVVEEDELDTNSLSDWGVTAKFGTLGLGAELDIALTDTFGARVGLNTYAYKYNADASTVNYDFHLKLLTVSAVADWYPFDDSSFRTSVGVMYNNNKVTLNGQPSGGTYTINGNTYSSTDVASLQGNMSFNKIAPYFGIGWGKPAPANQGWGMTTDFGVLFQGNPKTSLAATCGSAIAGTGTCTQLQNDAAAENAKLQNNLSNFKWWPVVSVGISYQW